MPVKSVVTNGTFGLGVKLRRPPGQQTVARHREEDPRLTVLEDQQHRRHRHGGAERDDPADCVEPGQLQRTRERVGDRELFVGHHPGEHDADNDVDQRADGEPAENAERKVPLGIVRFFGGRGDGVEPDVREEHDRGALVDAGEPFGAKGW